MPMLISSTERKRPHAIGPHKGGGQATLRKIINTYIYKYSNLVPFSHLLPVCIGGWFEFLVPLVVLWLSVVLRRGLDKRRHIEDLMRLALVVKRTHQEVWDVDVGFLLLQFQRRGLRS